MIGTRDFLRIARQISSPGMSGSIKSSMTSEMFSRASTSNASRPLHARNTRKPLLSRKASRTSRILGSSSTARILICSLFTLVTFCSFPRFAANENGKPGLRLPRGLTPFYTLFTLSQRASAAYPPLSFCRQHPPSLWQIPSPPRSRDPRRPR
ncbi:hypothetical protein SDC9_153547 [bioreactor metagenome]|uniref:Uncharacterized protein n=1 Tax=bioreactor metagenome TaxID=1076179 RepID=A0A645EW78_9ZZZZ